MASFELNVLISLAKLCEMQVRESGTDHFLVSEIKSGFEFCSDYEGCRAFLLGIRYGRREK